MKRIYVLLFVMFLLACKNDDQAQPLPVVPPAPNPPTTTTPTTEEPIPPVKITVPEELKTYYKGFDFTKTGTALYDDLAALTIAKHKNQLGYGERHEYLYKADASLKNPQNVVLVYTGEERFWREYNSGSNTYKPQTFNTEHIYPQSKYKGNAKGDLHHLKACDSKLNGSRGNIPFTDGKGKAGRTKGAWYPGDEWKGDVARMIMYINLRYHDRIDDVIVLGGLQVLLKWNDEDPVSDLERQRNNVIEKAQGNRNPFIDFPQLARPAYKGYKQ
ncbi:endonuclease [Capnocytophaga sp. oral taxon 902]|uniref:endonuclease I family protein n=1 Tax=Capnocytophaga sp. oral taxon 902 TaxID=2748316 RepID=UPI0015C08A11|nr:endonuclease [Capnocytophaga sp. oral taxon 902]QLF51367.1 endonuclease [Capnocytophaga sp. oral taxon 902]